MLRFLLGVSLLALSLEAIGATPADFEPERAQAEASCRAEAPSSDYHSCSCVGRRVAELAAQKYVPVEPRARTAHFERLKYAAYEACPQDDPSVIAASVNRGCVSIYDNQRTDYVTYCKCVGEDVASAFMSAPAIGMKQRDMLKTNAFLKCGAINESNRVKDMKTPVEAGGAAFEKVRADQEANCRQNSVSAVWNDCACVGRKMAEDAATAGENRPIRAQQAALEACPQSDKAPLEKHIFESCDSYMSSVRQDHDAFCKCTAQKTAAAYLAKPQMNMRYREKLRRDAMQACGL